MSKMLHRALYWTLCGALALSCASCAGTPQQRDTDPELDANPPEDNGQKGGNVEVSPDIQRAIAFIDKGSWDEAQLVLERALSSRPNDADAYAYLGLVLEKKNDPAGAEKAYLAAIERKPGQVQATLNLTGMYLTAKPPRVDDALKHLEKAISLAPDEVGLLANLGHARAAKGDIAGSAKAFDAAIAKGDSVELRIAAATVYFEVDKSELAVPHAKKVLEMKPTNPNTFVTVGFMLEYGEAFAECITAFDRAIKLKGDNPDWFLRRGRCKHEAGNDDAALEDFRTALKMKPDYVAAHFYSGVSLRDQQKLKEAEFSFQKAVELGKDTRYGKLAAKQLQEMRKGGKR